jgi:hypothetical protein
MGLGSPGPGSSPTLAPSSPATPMRNDSTWPRISARRVLPLVFAGSRDNAEPPPRSSKYVHPEFLLEPSRLPGRLEDAHFHIGPPMQHDTKLKTRPSRCRLLLIRPHPLIRLRVVNPPNPSHPGPNIRDMRWPGAALQRPGRSYPSTQQERVESSPPPEAKTEAGRAPSSLTREHIPAGGSPTRGAFWLFVWYIPCVWKRCNQWTSQESPRFQPFRPFLFPCPAWPQDRLSLSRERYERSDTGLFFAKEKRHSGLGTERS